MKNILIKKLPIIGGVLFAAMFTASASASLITLDFDSGFIASGVDNPNGITGYVDAPALLGNGGTDGLEGFVGGAGGTAVYNRIRWFDTGDANDAHSYLSIYNFTGLVLDTSILNSPVTLQTFMQENNTLSGTFNWNLDTINQLTIDGVAQTASTNTINFDETSNQGGNVAACGFSPSGFACDDIYTVDDIEAYIPLGPNLALHIFLEPGAGVVCLDDVVDPSLVNCWTPEVNPGFSSVHVRAELVAIPEPGMLALLGLGLVGFGAAARKRS